MNVWVWLLLALAVIAAAMLRGLLRRMLDPFWLTEVEGYDREEGGYGPVRVGTSAVIMREGKVLLGRRRGSHGAGLWSTPGGHLESGESFEQCVAREVEEETGLQVTDVVKLDFANNILHRDRKHYVTLYFKVRVAPGEPELREPAKCEGWRWFALDELPGESEIWPGMVGIFAALRS
jgi:8-oxo-dGTP diphosphatase